MKRAIGLVLSGVLGVVICVGIVTLAQALHLTPKIPAPGGEDDFALRAALFFFGLCPSFAALGVWIGVIAKSSTATAIRSWAGAIFGSFVVLITARIASSKFEGLTADGEGNRAAIVLFIIWFLAAVAGAYLLRRPRQQ